MWVYIVDSGNTYVMKNARVCRETVFLKSFSFNKLKIFPPPPWMLTAPGNGDGGSTSETPQPPRKKRARVDPTVENVSLSLWIGLWTGCTVSSHVLHNKTVPETLLRKYSPFLDKEYICVFFFFTCRLDSHVPARLYPSPQLIGCLFVSSVFM